MRQVARRAQIPKSTVHKILQDELKLKPYRLHISQELKENDYERRITFANWILNQLEKDPTFLSQCLWTDDAHFTIDGTVFTRNCVIWSPVNPHAIITQSLHPERVTAWCGFTSEFILKPFFFADATINQHNYRQLLEDYVIPELRRRRCLRRITFQQDGAPPHVAASVRDVLTATFHSRIISQRFETEWPPRSPDISPPDYC